MTANTKSLIEVLPEDEQFEFAFRKDKWFCSQEIELIFVAVVEPQVINGLNYFCQMYDGKNTTVPMGVMLLFVPTYQIQLTEDVREKIGCEQRKFQDSEIVCFVHGFRDLNTQVKLHDGSTVSIRSILYSLPTQVSSSPRRLLFHGADRCPQQDRWIYLKYNREDAAIFKRRMPRLAYDIAQLLKAGESLKVFADPDVGLEFGGEVRQKYSSKYPRGKNTTPVLMDPALLSHFNEIVSKMQCAPPKRPATDPTNMVQGYNDPYTTPNNGRSYVSGATLAAEASYVSRATSVTYTSTTSFNNSNRRATPGSVQTRTESIVVIEQYERRFVHMDSRLTTVEKSVNKSEKMPDSLLRHHGITIDTIEVDHMNRTTTSLSGPMELEHSGAMEGGSKRVCHGAIQSEASMQEGNHHNGH